MPRGLDCVVSNYRTPGDLGRFIESWRACRPGALPCQLMIVNVSPTPDDTKVAVDAKLDDPAIELLEYEDNIGYNRACNRGATGQGDVIALFNADVVLTPGALESCYQALVSEPEWGVLGPRQVDDHGRLTAAGIVGPEIALSHRGWMASDQGQYVDVLDDVATVAGSAMFIRRSVWRELTWCGDYQDITPGAEGAMLEAEHYYGETYLCHHARAHGYKVVYFGPVTIIHSWHRSSPVGGRVEQLMPLDHELFRKACDHHSIAHD